MNLQVVLNLQFIHKQIYVTRSIFLVDICYAAVEIHHLLKCQLSDHEIQRVDEKQKSTAIIKMLYPRHSHK